MDLINSVAPLEDKLKSVNKKSKELWDADPECNNEIVCASGGGVKCTRCNGWFCY